MLLLMSDNENKTFLQLKCQGNLVSRSSRDCSGTSKFTWLPLNLNVESKAGKRSNALTTFVQVAGTPSYVLRVMCLPELHVHPTS